LPNPPRHSNIAGYHVCPQSGNSRLCPHPLGQPRQKPIGVRSAVHEVCEALWIQTHDEKPNRDGADEVPGADALVWDQEHTAQLSSLEKRVTLLNQALAQQNEAAKQASEARAQSLDRESQGLVTPFERIQLERQHLRAHSSVYSLQSHLLLLEMMRALESGAQWARE
jgi:hypothetical protein